jgi:lysine-ketoglutarate reductase/saccharopine dehydrogenase-like protein (TIGR00300 family)
VARTPAGLPGAATVAAPHKMAYVSEPAVAPTPARATPATTEVLRLDGHVLDSLVLVKVLDAILDSGASYEILELDVGRTRNDESHVRLQVTAPSEEALKALVERLHVHGVNREDDADAQLAEVTQDGVLPEGFYSTTNLDTWVRVGGRWVEVAHPEMDCGILVQPAPGGAGEQPRARTIPMHQVRRGDLVVVGMHGARVATPSREPAGGEFAFMTSEVSPEKPKRLSVERVAASLRRARLPGAGSQRKKVLAVCGPAVVHTGAAPAVAALVREGWVQVLFAGNGFATHDIESSVLGTSLGVPLADQPRSDHGHANHLRVINTVRRFGSIANAVEAGWLRSGVLYECVRAGVPFVLGGSVRDDGPLPDVISDTVAATDAMREHLDGVGVALMLASTLHAVATGNLLPASVETFCVDINEAVVTKLADRGTHQALGIVTDVGLFAGELADILCGPSWREARRSHERGVGKTAAAHG